MTGLRRSIGPAAAAALLAAAAVVLPSAPAQAQTIPKHLAIYVAGVGTACAPSGTDGLTALDSRYNVKIGQPGSPTVGMVLFINGIGANSNQPKYWSYWHWSGGRWRYAGSGPAASHPPAGSSDGWVFGSYASTDRPPLPNADYASLCAGKDPTVAPSHPTVKPKPTHHATHTSSRYVPPAPTTSARGSSPKAKVSARPSTHPSPIPTTHTPSAGPTASAVALRAAPPRASSAQHSGLPPWGTALAIVVVAALGGAAFWRTRAQRQKSP